MRQQNASEDLEEARSVDLRRLHELGRKRLVVIAEKERCEAEAIDHVYEHEINGGVAEPPREAGRIDKRLPQGAELAEDHRHRNEHGLERNEAGEQHHSEYELVTRETPLRQDIAIERAEQSRNEDGRNDHLHRIPDVALDAFAGQANTGCAPRFLPRLEGQVMWK